MIFLLDDCLHPVFEPSFVSQSVAQAVKEVVGRNEELGERSEEAP